MAFSVQSNPLQDEETSGYMKARSRGFSGPLMFVVVIVAAIFVMSVFFRVSDIQVRGNVHYTDEEIIRAIDIEEGDNLFFFDRFAAIGRVFSKLPYIEQVSVERNLPNKVVITVEETTALAYLILGDEQWTMDRNCKILGKAASGETEELIPVLGVKPGTLLIGETMTTEDGDMDVVNYLAEILYQVEERGMAEKVTQIDFTNPQSPEFSYGGKYTVVLGDYIGVEHKFGMFVSVLQVLKDGDMGVLDVSDGVTTHFSPN